MSKSDLSQELREGQLLLLETGEYSDRQWHGPFKMLVTVTKQVLVDCYRRGGDATEDNPRLADQFVPWLVASGFAEELDAHAWHIGSYGEFEP